MIPNWRGQVDTLKGGSAIQKGLEEWVTRSFTNFSKTKQLGSTSAGKDLEVLVGRKLNMSQQCNLAAKMSASWLFNRSIARQLKEVITCFYLAFVPFWPLNTRKILINWSKFSGGPPGSSGGWRTWPMRRSCETGACTTWRRDGFGET